MIKKSTRGSEWRKWDLHIHTPASYDYKNKGITNAEFIQVLEDNEISAVAITDHHIIDIDRIKDLSEKAKQKGIVVFPGIEILSDARGREPIHIIGIFSNKSNINHIWSQIKAKTDISKIEGEGKAINEIYCNLNDTIKLIHELGGIVTIHAGHKSNSIENISHTIPQGDAQKQDIAGVVDIFEVENEQDVNDYNTIVNSAIEKTVNKRLPVIVCSDNHNINEYTVKQNCWIKANTTFEGLKQILYEPSDRVRIQEEKPEQKNDYQIINSISFNNKEMGQQEILFNQNLNSIIGGRSSGKSILLGCLACLNDSGKEAKEPEEYFKDYNSHVHEIAKKATVKWRDSSTDARKIIYYSQSEISQIVRPNEYGITGINGLLEGIIKKEQGKLELIQQYDKELISIKTKINSKINDYCELKRQINEKNDLISEIGDKKGIIGEINKIEKEIEFIQKTAGDYLSDQENIAFKEQKDKLEKNEIKINNLFSDKTQFNILKSADFFISFDSQISGLSSLYHDKVLSFYNEIKETVKEKWIQFVEKQIQDIASQEQLINSESTEITESNLFRKGKAYNDNNKILSSRNDVLKEEKNKKNMIEKEEVELEKLKMAKDSCKKEIWETYIIYKNLTEKITNKLVINKDKVSISARSNLIYKKFFEIALGAIDRRNKDVKKYDYYSEISTENQEDLIRELFDGITNDTVALKKDYQQTLVDLYSNCYYEISYDVIYEGDSFKTMSEGKKAFIVLRLLLDFDDSKCPIIIDQPEDDLDNRAIYEKLVTYLREQKKKRQIILATHNPNVVVGADSELVIVANQNGTDSPNQDELKFEYYGNGIEDSFKDNTATTVLLKQGIREHICDILEGGNVAFQIREKKYGYKDL